MHGSLSGEAFEGGEILPPCRETLLLLAYCGILEFVSSSLWGVEFVLLR